ncbi:FkbM family methyltransferase [Ectothiorhodospira marina]
MSLNLFTSEPTNSSASLIENFRPNSEVAEKLFIPAFSFKSISNLISFDDIGIIKIDVEGAELEVIKSLLEPIKLYRPIIVLEILPVYNEANNFRLDRQKEIEQIFRRINYVIHRIAKNGDKFSSLSKIDAIGIHSNLTQCDYVVAPEEIVLSN